MNHTTKTNTKSTKMGSYSAFLTLIVIAVIIVVNLMVGELPTTLTKLDTSSIELYTLSDISISMARGLSEDVTFYLIAPKGEEDASIQELLRRYASYSSHVQIKTVDPNANPAFVSKYTEEQLYSNSVIVESAKRASVVSYTDIYTTEYNYYYYSYGIEPTGTTYFNGEQAFTTAIDYVTGDDLPVLYIVTGHGEATVSNTILADIKAENILTEELSLLTVTEIPKDAGAVIINAPTKDITEEERDVLLAYMGEGGKLILITGSESYTAEGMPNIAAIAAAYGLEAVDGLVIEGDTSRYYRQPYGLLPTLNTSAVVAGNMSSTNIALLVPYAHGIAKTEDAADTLSIEAILSSTDKSHVIADIDARAEEYTDAEDISGFYEKREGDAVGPFYIGAYAEDTATGGKLVWTSSSCFIGTDGYSDYYTYNGELFLSTLTTLCEKSSSISIRGKSMQVQSLSVSVAEASFWGIALCLIVPVGAAALGFVIWFKRRKR